MGNLVFATQDAMTGAAITAGPYAATGGPANLIRPEPSDALVLTDPAQAYAVVHMPAAPPVRLVAPLYVSGGRPTHWRYRAADTEAGLTAAPAVDSGSIAFASGATGLRHRGGGLHAWALLDAAAAHAWWRVDLTGASAPIVWGQLVLADPWQLARNIAYGWSMGLIDPSRKPRAVQGQVEPLNRSRYMGGEFSVDFASEAEMWGDGFDLDQVCGTTTPALVIRDPDLIGDTAQRQAIWGLFSELSPIANPVFDLYSKRWRIEELLP